MRMLHHPARDDITLSGIFYALSDPTRQDIVKDLATITEKTCGAFGQSVAKSTMSHHFKVLRESGLTRTRLEGTQSFISLRRDDLDLRFPGLLDTIIEACAREEKVHQETVGV
ncbi:MAG TPA: helix-turn-helix transcriptional regulator [Ktedonosporobacter sp.]|nr:helix-turn-helix transcriptional regulator [Ktedonosporobacter sp.]